VSEQLVDGGRGTWAAPKFREVFTQDEESTRMHGRCFTYRSGAGFVAGFRLSVMFAIDQPVASVWQYLKDFNLWQNSYGYFWSHVVGDADGQRVRLGFSPAEPMPYEYDVKVIPEYVIVLSQPPARESMEWPGLGEVDAGFHVVTLDEYDGQTIVTFQMEHASLMARAPEADEMTEDEAIAPWREGLEETGRMWRDFFIPDLTRLVSEGAGTRTP